MIEVYDPGLQYYVDMLNGGQPYTFIRMGDGEWSAIMGDRGRTSSGSQTLHHESLRNGMIKVVCRRPEKPIQPTPHRH